jgi:hypothetical protein
VSDVGTIVFWLVVLGFGGWRAYRDRVDEIDERRVTSFIDWIERPLAEPPGETDWEAFERRVERELRAADRPPVDVVLPYAVPARPGPPGRSARSRP